MTSGITSIPSGLSYPFTSLKRVQEKVCGALKTGLFQPYEAALRHEKSMHWSRESWWDYIQKISQGQEVSSTELKSIELFTIVIDPEIPSDEKRALLVDFTKDLPEKTEESLYYALVHSAPAIVSTSILRYAGPGMWQQVSKALFRHRTVTNYEPIVLHWIEEAVKNQWPTDEKGVFLSSIFSQMPDYERDDLLCYVMANGDEATCQAFSKLAPEPLNQKFVDLSRETAEKGEQILKSKANERFPSFRGNQQRLLVTWFKDHCERPNSELIALHLDKNDWSLLSKLKNDLDPVASRWMVCVAERLLRGEFAAEVPDQPQNTHDSRVWLFFNYASNLFAPKEQSKDEPVVRSFVGESEKKAYASIAFLWTPALLQGYFSAFREDAKSFLLQEIVLNEPDTFTRWVSYILTKPLGYGKQISSEITGLIEKAKDDVRTKALLSLMDSGESAAHKLTIYSCLKDADRETILSHLAFKGDPGIELLSTWIELTSSPAEELPGFVPSAFAKNFTSMLEKISPPLCETLRKRWSHLNPDVLASLLDAEPPEGALQRLAIQKLKIQFQTPHISYQDRQEFIRSIQQDLREDLKQPPIFLKLLFEQLPEETWPLIFLHFEHVISRGHFFAYFEEKSKGGIFKAVDPEQPVSVSWLPDINTWVDYASKAMCQMVDNPLLNTDNRANDSTAPHALQHLYAAACQTNTIYLILERFVKMVPPQKFLSIMNIFGGSCFYHNPSGFKQLVNRTMTETDVNRVNLVVNALIGHFLRIQQTRVIHTYSTDLDDKLWNEPFLCTPQERSDAAKGLVQQLGVGRFLAYFDCARWDTRHAIIESWMAVDPIYGKEVWARSLDLLCLGPNDNPFIFKQFQQMASSYEKAGVDLSFITHNTWIAKIKQWLSSPDLQSAKFRYSDLTIRLLQRFLPDTFRSILIAQYRALVEEESGSAYSISTFVHALEKTGEGETLFKQVHEQPELLALTKTVIERNFADHFESDFYGKWTLFVIELFPDWQERLSSWACAKMKKAQETSISYGNAPSYYEIVNICTSLDRIKKLDEWIHTIEQTPDLQKEVPELLKQYEAKKEQDAKDSALLSKI